MTTDVTLTEVLSNAQSTSQQSVTLAEDFDDFLVLLTTQLQNQDPLAPMDSTEFTNQLVQFSQVEQSINTNEKLDSLVQMQMSNLSSMALNFIGMEVTYPSVDLYYDGTDGSDIIYVFDEEVTDATLYIYDANDELVYSTPVEGATGTSSIEWDGIGDSGEEVEPGTYSIYISGFNGDEDSINATTVVSGLVHGVETQNGIPYLLIGDRAVQQTTVINAKYTGLNSVDETSDTSGDDTDETATDETSESTDTEESA